MTSEPKYVTRARQQLAKWEAEKNKPKPKTEEAEFFEEMERLHKTLLPCPCCGDTEDIGIESNSRHTNITVGHKRWSMDKGCRLSTSRWLDFPRDLPKHKPIANVVAIKELRTLVEQWNARIKVKD